MYDIKFKNNCFGLIVFLFDYCRIPYMNKKRGLDFSNLILYK
jgi:hypothetical protein